MFDPFFNFDPFKKLSTKQENILTERLYTLYILQDMLGLFEYNGLPGTIPYEEIEKRLLVTGMCAIGKIDDELVVGDAIISGNLDKYGIGEDVTLLCVNGDSISGKRNKDIAVIFNNPLKIRESTLITFPQLYTDVLKSLRCALKNSRANILPVVPNSKVADSVKQALNDIDAGKNATVLDDDVLSMFDNNTQGLRVLSLTNVNDSDKIQYISKLYDDVTRWIANIYGMNVTISTKQAQVNSDELAGYDAVSTLYPTQMLNMRKRGIDIVNNIFDTSITVDFSEALRQTVDKVSADTAEETADNSADNSAVETEEDAAKESEGKADED